MPQPVARQNDPVIGVDTHILLTPAPTPTPLPFSGKLMTSLSVDVLINGLPAATQGSIAQNLPPHVAPSAFSKPPTNLGRVVMGSPTVLINGKPLARVGDQVATCNDPVDLPVSSIIAGSTDVMAG